MTAAVAAILVIGGVGLASPEALISLRDFPRSRRSGALT
jgi:hypothetical protein